MSRARASRGWLLVAGLAAAALLAYVVTWLHLSHTDAVGSDYSTFHVAALEWREGQGAHLYDQAAETARHEALVPPGYHVDLPYISPPTAAVATAPLTPLDLETAFRLASAAELALAALAVWMALAVAPRPASDTPLRRLATAAVALAGAGTLVMLLMGQWDGLCALGVAVAYAGWRRGRWGLGGVALALTMAPTKPHLALGLVALLIGARQLRGLAGIGLGGALVLATGCLVDGLRGWSSWLSALDLSSHHSPLASLLGYTGLTGSLLGDTPLARTLGLAASGVALLTCVAIGVGLRRHPERLEPALAGALALGLAAAPHLLMHDLVVLAPAAVAVIRWAAARSSAAETRALTGWLALNVCALLDLGRSDVGLPGRLVPWALTLLGAAAVWTEAWAPAQAPTALGATASARPPRPAQLGSGSGLGGVVDQS